VSVHRDQILGAARAAFPACDPADVLTALDQYGVEPYEREVERVQLAIIELSGGDMDRLLHFVQVAKTDYRNVLAWQELGPLPEAEGRRLQDEARALIEQWGKKQPGPAKR
jgi:hypothetical protein